MENEVKATRKPKVVHEPKHEAPAAAAEPKPEPKVVEKVVEKIVEKVVHVHNPAQLSLEDQAKRRLGEL